MLEYLRTPSGFFGAILSATRTTTYIQPDTPAEYLGIAQDVLRIIEKVNPDYILVDFVFNAARDAITKLARKEKVSLLIANTAKDMVMSNQGLRTFTFPCVVSGYPYPLPLYLYPANIFLIIFYGLWLFIFDGRHRRLNKARNAAGYPGVLPLFDTPQERTTLCMSSTGADLPLVIPDWLICCGPILQASKPLQSSRGERGFIQMV
ncbi:hypothetical protein I302_100260 [Kwoniella bestiolae CBS 10118]|uniref:Uncharacterized protein n=1 Tax=Kwoniella bestiolae CBS 10118 TaxID=1296100 RepID=A0A1B9G4L5_9TREE|nr:hypothetical protein I302_03633 [Kwoniella bestiolae CBS 10118]OCF25956.1 hypothetical protein I302_03633 [Kwoniella bestiolae CBS 10118]